MLGSYGRPIVPKPVYTEDSQFCERPGTVPEGSLGGERGEWRNCGWVGGALSFEPKLIGKLDLLIANEKLLPTELRFIPVGSCGTIWFWTYALNVQDRRAICASGSGRT